ncbi:MAG: DUF4236 domain-containing protein [Bryobacteraceae bacterium]
MPWRFRKVFRFGPMRGWLSRSGIGYSFGFPGFRIGVAASGYRYLTVGIPGTGLYFIKYFGGPRSGSQRTVQPPTVGPRGMSQSSGSLPANTRKSSGPSVPRANQKPWWRQKNLP